MQKGDWVVCVKPYKEWGSYGVYKGGIYQILDDPYIYESGEMFILPVPCKPPILGFSSKYFKLHNELICNFLDSYYK